MNAHLSFSLRILRCVALGWFALAFLPFNLHAGPVPEPPFEWRYQLLGDSTYLDDCPPCGRPSFLQNLRGSFVLVPGRSDPLFTRHRLVDIRWFVGGESPDAIRLEGTGELEFGGEVALVQRLSLHLTITRPDRTEVVDFESGTQPGEPPFPSLSMPAVEANPSPFRVLHLQLEAMPLRALWFTTRAGFTAALPGPKPRRVHGAELLSLDGQIVVPLDTFRTMLGIPELDPAFRLDAAAVATGGGLEFSFDADTKSTVLGVIHHGDLLGWGGTRVETYQHLGSIIGPEPPTPDLGLDAAFRLPDGTLLFSTTTAVFSERFGVTVGSGDIVASSGQLWRRNAELLKAFKPLHPEKDYGLDALYVWPDGEVWFSTEQGVELVDSRGLTDGDLLSDRGRVIYRNLEFVRAFSPLEELANFGLDSLMIATDVSVAAKPPRLESVRWLLSVEDLRLDWSGPGRFYQVEYAPKLEGPYTPLTPLVIGNSATVHPGTTTGFLRLRQW